MNHRLVSLLPLPQLILRVWLDTITQQESGPRCRIISTRGAWFPAAAHCERRKRMSFLAQLRQQVTGHNDTARSESGRQLRGTKIQYKTKSTSHISECYARFGELKSCCDCFRWLRAWCSLKQDKQNLAEEIAAKHFGFTFKEVTSLRLCHPRSHCWNTATNPDGGFKPRAKSCVFSLSPLMGHAGRGWLTQSTFIQGEQHLHNRYD